ncbi:MAG: Phenylalanyl-tRNA synthetase subunit beta [Candidatus Berkelbacteria bacterium Licking1014_96]|uniref:Phenylalanine--tRNA ligase beta subunit n=1 Tax=Candidatus Berkelbacteria bacterium Licking1014_96 TaxID=2017149 RepID=A0A554LCH5_9BACT|nr:MAG: Phenylalanyl-tRNA synthetase subunit beta [Candidatus Berkelbacteria bacterium Licking1014_96]
MKISFDWLKEFVKINKTAEEMAEILTLSGTEVESVQKKGKDCILDLDITPNRGDELSVLGIAREVSVLTGNKLTRQSSGDLSSTTSPRDDKPLTVEILDPQACPRFTCRIIDKIKIKPSPKWIADRLESYGFRPINNVVDITNLVMIELGQPLHAFDYDKISGHKMIVRRAKNGERVKTLDGMGRILSESAIIIEDDKNLIDLAGIMGGKLSEVSNETKTIILEAAIFNPVLIRKTAKEQALVTDASYRFERGIDQDGQIRALNMAAELILKCAGGETAPVVDINKIKFEPKQIKINLKKISSLLGIKIEKKEAEKYLNSLGFDQEGSVVEVPSWRNDVSIWQDVAEEIIRIKGYDKLKTELLPKEKPKQTSSTFKQKELLKDRLNDLDLAEIYSYDFLSSKDLEILKKTDEGLYEIENPVAPENRYLRDSLFPSLIKAIAKNPTYPQIRIFEIGQVFNLKNGERTYLGIGLAGDKNENITEIIDKINQTTLSDLKWQTKVLDEEERRRYKIKKKFTAMAEADLFQFLVDMPMRGKFDLIKDIQYREISKFPSIARDFAFIVGTDVKDSDLADVIKKISALIVRVELFDEFESNKFGKNKKSLAYHLEFQSPDKTLTKKEGDELSKKIIKLVKDKFKGTLRGK